MHFETFAKGSSPLHKLDPRVRVISAVFLSFTFAMGNSLYLALAGIGLGMGLTLAARFPLLQVACRMAAVNLFLVLVWMLLPFSFPAEQGNAAFALGPFTASWEGIRLALLITVKSNSIILLNLALLCSMRVVTLVRALEALRVPGKLCQTLFFSLRYFQVIHAEYHRLHDAMKMRGFCPGTNLHTIRSYGQLLSMLMVRSLNRGQRIYEAMLCRGYTGELHTLQEFCLRRADKAFLISSLFATILLWAGQMLL